MLENEQWGEPATFERLTVGTVRCVQCGATLSRTGAFAVRVNRRAFVRQPDPAACPRCLRRQPAPRLFVSAMEVDAFFRHHCGRPFDAGLLVPEAEVHLTLHQRNGTPAPDS
jgi:hypothetical protein